ncbi:MAG: Dabb family protein [Eubacteriales bacterium]|nr:Dabb family protein [Eubacteriales bacterium]
MKHCILAKFRSDVDAAEKKALLPELESLFAPLLDIEGIHKVEVIPNVVDRSNRYDILIRIDMDRDALETYDASEPHHDWKEEYGAYLEKKAIFDYD